MSWSCCARDTPCDFEPGRFADFAILDEDPDAVNPIRAFILMRPDASRRLEKGSPANKASLFALDVSGQDLQRSAFGRSER